MLFSFEALVLSALFLIVRIVYKDIYIYIYKVGILPADICLRESFMMQQFKITELSRRALYGLVFMAYGIVRHEWVHVHIQREMYYIR